VARRRVTWARVRDPLYALLGAAIIVPQIISGQWNPLACGVALAFCGLPGVIALNEWGRPRDGSDSTPPSSGSSSPPSVGSSSSGQLGGERRDESA
jgi:hypothetical protein